MLVPRCCCVCAVVLRLRPLSNNPTLNLQVESYYFFVVFSKFSRHIASYSLIISFLCGSLLVLNCRKEKVLTPIFQSIADTHFAKVELGCFVFSRDTFRSPSLQQPYRSSPPDAGGVPQRPAQSFQSAC